MKFLVSIPGHTRTVPMGHFVPKALQQLGHEVVVFNHERDSFSDRMREKVGMKRYLARKNRLMRELVDAEKPDVFFAIYGKTHDVEALEFLKERGIPRLCWWLNDPFDLAHQHIPVAHYDHFFTNSRHTHNVYHHYGARQVHYLPVGIDPDVHKPLPAVEKKYDVVFAGDWHPIREAAMNMLLQAGVKLTLMGPWHRRIPRNSPLLPHFVKDALFTPGEMSTIFNEARIVLNLHTWYGRWDYGVNPRLFEASGCRAFQVCDVKQEISDLYVPGREVVLYKRTEELPELLAHYLPLTAERERIAEAALARTLRDHTYVQRMQEMLLVSGLVK